MFGATTVCVIDYVSRSDGFFVKRHIPAAQVLPEDLREELHKLGRQEKERGKQLVLVRMPDGTVEEIPSSLPPEIYARLDAWIESLKPTFQVQWLRLLIVGFGMPLVIWALSEAAVFVIQWIGKGFSSKDR